MFIPENHNFTAFKNKVWLSSPTMHSESKFYMDEAFDTNWMSTVGANINEVEKWSQKKSAAAMPWCCPPERRRSILP